jgi:cell division protease FtsH
MQKNKITNWLPYLIVIVAIASLFSLSSNASTQTLSYKEIKSVLSEETIDAANVSIGSNITTIKVLVKDANGRSTTMEGTLPSTNDEIAETLKSLDKTDAKVTIVDAAASNLFVETLVSLIPFVLLAGLAVWMINRMNGAQSANGKAFEFSQSRAKLEGKIRVRFSDVAGCDEEKQEMAEIIEYLKVSKEV